MAFIILHVTFPNIEEARNISKMLIEKDLIKCVNFSSVNSMYKWQGELVDENEIVAIMKLPSLNHEVVEKKINKLHSDSCPCIIKMDVTANKEYDKWINST